MIEIINQKDKFDREVWRFYWENPFHIWLNEYRIQHREPRKHNWDDIKVYTRIGDTKRFPKEYLLQEKDVPLTSEIICQIRAWVIQNTKVKYWSER